MHNRLLLLVLPLVFGLFFLIKKGFENQIDPDWLATERLLKTEYFTLSDATDSLQILYDGFQKKHSADSTALKILAAPLVPTMTFSKFKSLFERVTTQRFTVISAVSGMGATTISERLARLIASRPENLLMIKCAPQFDLKLHEQLIGHTENNFFIKGELVKLWDEAARRPEEKFVALIDNLDKINPETFFGPDLWEILPDSKTPLLLGGQRVVVPKNFYLISVTHLGEGSKIELSNEQFKRLGNQLVLEPHSEELAIFIQQKRVEIAAAAAQKNPIFFDKNKELVAAISDSAHIQKLVYFFTKANQLMAARYSPAYQLGWTNVRKLILQKDFPAVRQLFIDNANGLKPRLPMSEKEFDDIDCAIKTGGLLPNSNFFARQIGWLLDLGFFTEFVVIFLTAIATAIAGWWLFRKSRRHIVRLNGQVAETMQLFENQQLTGETAWLALRDIKQEMNEMVLGRKIGYTEGLYFLRNIDEQTRRLEIARQTGEMFSNLVETFLEDNVLSDSEYQKLVQFLNGMRHKIPAADWQRYRDEVEAIYQKFKSLS